MRLYNKPKSYKLAIKIWYPSDQAKTKDKYAISKEEIVRTIEFGQRYKNDLLSLRFFL